jgi:nucleoside-diphosphate-sugar epimerase
VFDNQTWPQFIGDAAKGVRTRILDDSARSFIHVEDVVGAIALAVSKGLTGEIDIMFKKKVRPSELLGALGYRFEVIDEIQHLDYSAHLKTDSLLANGWLPAKTEEVLRLR